MLAWNLNQILQIIINNYEFSYVRIWREAKFDLRQFPPGQNTGRVTIAVEQPGPGVGARDNAPKCRGSFCVSESSACSWFDAIVTSFVHVETKSAEVCHELAGGSVAHL
jgi:hypothetical protein